MRVWNYVDKTLELAKHFNEEAHAVRLPFNSMKVILVIIEIVKQYFNWVGKYHVTIEFYGGD